MGRGLVVGLLVATAIVSSACTRAGQASTSQANHVRADIAPPLNGERAQTWTERNRPVACQPSADCHSHGTDVAGTPISTAPRSEPAFVIMVMVVVFLSVLRAGFQLRDAADARFEESRAGAGL